MMTTAILYLIGSIVLTSYLTLTFKVIGRFGISAFQAIVFNYCTCVITGSVVNGSFPIHPSTLKEAWLPWAILMGTMFISIFNILGVTTQKINVAVASVANKLSLVIPFVFSLYLYAERPGMARIIGIGIALLAVLLTCLPSKKPGAETSARSSSALIYFLPAVLFISSGLLDTVIKFTEHKFLDDSNNNAFLITAFAVAATIGLCLLVVFVTTGRETFTYKSILAGIAIGIPNYFSIWCLVKVLKMFAGNSSAVIPVNNMGIVLFSALAAVILFKEKLSFINWIGIILSVFAIALIAFG